MKPILVLAGGFGTRLRSLVSDVPKPLAPVAKRAFIEHLIEHWVAQGAKDVIFLLHYQAEQIQSLIADLSGRTEYSKIRFRVVVEERPLGTGGAVLNGINKLEIKQGFLVANADTWLGSGIKQLAAAQSPALVAISVPDRQRYGSITLKGDTIVAFEEKGSAIGRGFINSGLYNLLPEVFHGHTAGSSFSIEREVFPNLVASRKLGVVRLEDSFIDIGIPEDYLRFCKWVNLGRKHEL